MSAFGPKQTCRKTQSMSLLGIKRTCLSALHMSAFDPKRTLSRAAQRAPSSMLVWFCAMPCSGPRGEAMRRRDLIKVIAGSVAAWPLAARAQQPEQVRRVGALLPATADDAVFQARLGVFLQELAILGWVIGRNIQFDVRWASADAGEIRRHAAELVALKRSEERRVGKEGSDG